MMLFSTPGLKVPCANLNLLCQQHFKPEDIRRRKTAKGKLVHKLKRGALPVPIKKPTHQRSVDDNSIVFISSFFPFQITCYIQIVPIDSVIEKVKKVSPVETEITLVDIDRIRNVEHTTSTLGTPENE